MFFVFGTFIIICFFVSEIWRYFDTVDCTINWHVSSNAIVLCVYNSFSLTIPFPIPDEEKKLS